MAWSNPNPSQSQKVTGQPTSAPEAGPDPTYVETQAWYLAEAEAATTQAGERRTPTASKLGG
jgi:hypothetical protein